MKEFDEYTRRNLPRIAQHYDVEHQLKKLYEEGEEMLEALRDVMDNGKDEKRVDHLIEEIGDVFNVAEQIALLLDREDLLSMSRAYKVERQLRRVRQERGTAIMGTWTEPAQTFINDNGKAKPHLFYAGGTD